MSKNSKDIVFTSALRTSVGKFGGIHKNLQAHELGSIVIKGILNKTNIDVGEIDDDHRVYLTISYQIKTDGSTDALTTTFE